MSVSYTHLDVYKRQTNTCKRWLWISLLQLINPRLTLCSIAQRDLHPLVIFLCYIFLWLNLNMYECSFLINNVCMKIVMNNYLTRKYLFFLFLHSNLNSNMSAGMFSLVLCATLLEILYNRQYNPLRNSLMNIRDSCRYLAAQILLSL